MQILQQISDSPSDIPCFDHGTDTCISIHIIYIHTYMIIQKYIQYICLLEGNHQNYMCSVFFPRGGRRVSIWTILLWSILATRWAAWKWKSSKDPSRHERKTSPGIVYDAGGDARENRWTWFDTLEIRHGNGSFRIEARPLFAENIVEVEICRFERILWCKLCQLPC